jgi:hypothetical protein
VTELERKQLVETDRHIAECEAYIAKQWPAPGLDDTRLS